MRDLKTLYDNETKLLHVCNDIETNGILIDEEYVEAGLRYEEEQTRKAKEDFEAFTARSFKNSSKLFAEIFAERSIPFPKTGRGNPRFDRDFLDTCRAPEAERIKKIRYHEKRASTYFLNYKNSIINGKIHPSMNQAGTVTGRFSYSNPNFQNVPKDAIDNPSNVRKCFIPPEGFDILSIDYDQMEYRLFLDYAEQQDVIDRVMDGEDLHQVTAEMLGVERKTAKTLNFAILYGTGAENLAQMLGCTKSDAQRIKQKYFRALPQVSKLIRNIQKAGERRGWIENRFGRRYSCDDFRMSYKLPNYLFQGTGADVIKHAMVDIHRMLSSFKTNMFLQVHDEIIFYLHKDEYHLIDKIKNIMENSYESFTNMKLTVSYGTSSESWGHIDG